MTLVSTRYILILMALFVAGFLLGSNAPAASVQSTGAADSGAAQDQAPAEDALLSLPVPTALDFPEATDRGCDVLVIIDSTQGLAKADPAGYWKSAVKLFISLLSIEDRVGIVRADSEAVLLSPLTQNIEQSRPALFHSVEKAGGSGAVLDLPAALQKGLDELTLSSRARRIMVLMTGGTTTTGSAGSTALQNLHPKFAQAKVGFFAVTVGVPSENPLLRSMTGATGGAQFTAPSDRDTHVQLTRLYDRLRSPDHMTLDNEAFLIDRDIREAVIAATRKPGTALTLVDPSGRTETAPRHGPRVAWYRSDLYDLITLQRPDPGTWRLRSALTGSSSIFVQTDLVLKSTLSSTTVPVGTVLPYAVWLEKQRTPLSFAVAADAPAFTAEVTGPEGQSVVLPLASSGQNQSFAGQERAGGSLALTVPGDHRVRLVARSATFLRERLVTVVVKPAVSGTAAAAGSGQGPARPAVQDVDEGFSWLVLLFRFFAVNITVAAVGGAIFSIRVLIIKTRSRR